MTRSRAVLLYAAMSVPFGILVHLASEFAALGRDADDIAFSPLHAYLAVLAVAAFATFFVAGGFFAGASERRRRMSAFTRALPRQGRGPVFLGFSIALQFGFFLVTQVGEGCPMCGGDLIVGVVAAVVASIAGSIVLRALRPHLVRIVCEVCEYLRHVPVRTAPVQDNPFGIIFVPAPLVCYAVVLANRPPPIPPAR